MGNFSLVWYIAAILLSTITNYTEKGTKAIY
ncbi:hypothetical protein SpiGrapes_1292 [Sphaerochaeta pleomorpha str. Grapes]|uniref:Uncharacterized protein n=1 Tax=Sphaerochaeta pleomorpha (strain ATCC BAA-1885 / DSM 22778 / Grapes) TaxID=158190 RepID=G8QTS9_SPHPG|nr:hypothetical protein SpiGrapes_1292 [Sphaerochaeta pleomorpha str. Grapes]